MVCRFLLHHGLLYFSYGRKYNATLFAYQRGLDLGGKRRQGSESGSSLAGFAFWTLTEGQDPTSVQY